MQIGTTRSFVQCKIFHYCLYYECIIYVHFKNWYVTGKSSKSRLPFDQPCVSRSQSGSDMSNCEMRLRLKLPKSMKSAEWRLNWREPYCTKIMRLDRPLNSNPGMNIVLSVTDTVGLFQLELGRYRYLESVFGIFVGIFSCRFGIRYRYFEIPRYSVSVSVFLKYW